MKNEDKYVLGEDRAELRRLGLQHQIWSEDTRQSWKIAEFGNGQTILDLGCGPGFCSLELGYIVGDEGKVIAVDQSKVYANFLKQQNDHHRLPIEIVCEHFEDLRLMDYSLDGIYTRWALGWLKDPEKIIEKLVRAMDHGGVFVAHEYFDWSTLDAEPELAGMIRAKRALDENFKIVSPNINVGRKLPGIFFDFGLEVIHCRLIQKLALPEELTWQWPQSFLHTYLPKLYPKFLSRAELEEAMDDLDELENLPGAFISCPTVMEIIAVKG